VPGYEIWLSINRPGETRRQCWVYAEPAALMTCVEPLVTVATDPTVTGNTIHEALPWPDVSIGSWWLDDCAARILKDNYTEAVTIG
jgi:hypothetical protein